jgi:hypothetical protein
MTVVVPSLVPLGVALPIPRPQTEGEGGPTLLAKVCSAFDSDKYIDLIATAENCNHGGDDYHAFNWSG